MFTGKTICTVCDYIYDDLQCNGKEQGAPAVAFADLPAQWVCPVCGASKDMFQPCSCVHFEPTVQRDAS